MNPVAAKVPGRFWRIARQRRRIGIGKPYWLITTKSLRQFAEGKAT